MKQISIIIPCYNAEKYIRRCLDSVVGQTIGVDNLEIIAVNDASTDGTLDVLLEYESKYPDSMLVINCEENHQEGGARNIGLTYASADYVGYMDDDDWCEPDMFEIMYKKAVEHDCDMVHFDGFIADERTNFDAGGILIDINTPEERSKMIACGGLQIVAPWTFLIKKSMLLEYHIEFPEKLVYVDNFWAGLLCLYAEKIFWLEQPLYHHVRNESSNSCRIDLNKDLQILDVCLMLWQEYEKRGMYDLYREAVEFHFLYRFYTQGLRLAVFRGNEMRDKILEYIINTIRTLVPGWKRNRYIEAYFPPERKPLLKWLEYPCSKENLKSLAECVAVVMG